MHAPPSGLVYAIYYPVLAAIAVPANLVAIVILSRGRCGLSKCITWYLVSMAVTDFLVVITGVILNRIIGIYFPFSVLSTTVACSLSNALIFASRDSSVWLTVAFTFDRFVAICCQNLKAKYCTEKTAAVVIGTVCALISIKSVPWYFIHEPKYIIDNIPWYCNIKLSFYTSPAWRIFGWFDRISIPCLPLLLMLLLNALTVRHILVASRVRRRIWAKSNGENQSDPEMESRRKSIVLLFTISGSFILLWTPNLINFLYVTISNGYYSTGSNLNDPKFILQESANMLQLLSCCTNTCIYVGTQSKFRDELKNMIKYPLNIIINQLNKDQNKSQS
ncbi:probable G-protein coupled receptor 139 [Heterodontus francisci]|uniref:probable G-protein coupled receptor 139 n=1 Tax=Heterodontus francisci TaxID=7792 RepID=UPI00355C02D5